MFTTVRRSAPYSLRRRLFVAMLTGFFLIISVAAFGLWDYARRSADRTYDFLLDGSAIAILERVSFSQEGVSVDFPPAALEILGLADQDRVFYRIFDATGTTLTGSDDLPLPPQFKPEPQHRLFDAAYRGEEARFVIQSKYLVADSTRQWIGVEVGQTRIGRDSMQKSLFLNGLLGLTGIAVVGLIFGRAGISLAMRPLIGIEADLDRRDPSDLTPINAKPPREVEALIMAINGFMRRLDASRSNAQSFIADVAHQIRTSLSTLSGQLELASAQGDGEQVRTSVKKASAQAAKTIHLTNQLLSHAMVVHRADQLMTDRVDLRDIAREIIEEAVRADGRGVIEFEFDDDGLDKGYTVQGDAISLREAMRNLIDNAIKHVGDGAVVRIVLSNAVNPEGSPAVAFSIEDNGPGIPAGEYDNVVKRFYTIGKHGGSGLGLAIVDTVARSHQGRFRLSRASIGGLKAEIVLPAGRRED